MRIVISPAKKLHQGVALPDFEVSQPQFLAQAQALINILQEKDSFEIASLMKLSIKLADLNTQRFQHWHTPFTPNNARQAIFSFAGDVYQSLNADTLSPDDIEFAQNHLRILSGLYGLLRPLDIIQPYRLEMGTPLVNPQGNNLYDFWGNQITEQMNQELSPDDTLINLASNEYFKVIKPKILKAQIITPTFRDNKNGQYKTIGIFAKKARGFMTRFIIQNRITQAHDIQAFDMNGYTFNPSMSDEKTWVFTRG